MRALADQVEAREAAEAEHARAEALACCRALKVRTCVLLYPDRARSLRFEVADRQNVIATDGFQLAQDVGLIEAAMMALQARLLVEAMRS